ncbi:MAG TPA: class I SAM-dependent RNA methyltransferase [Rhodospirillaceae bacterium]|nr:class I SAM-dependent RNA methyltransferase [Rhodospirillaceae bacterium]
MTILELTIDDIGAQGDGIAHQGGNTVFITGALTGERVRASIDDSKNMVKRGELLELLVPCSLREKPPCAHFPQCGGCRFQHMNDAAYSNFKLGQLQQTLLRAGLTLPPFQAAVTTATQTRRRARFAVRHDKGGIVLGFNEWRSHNIVNLSMCSVMRPEIVALMEPLRKHLPMWLPRDATCDIQVTVLAGGLDVVIIGGPKLELNQRHALAELGAALKVAHLSWRKWDRSPVEPIAHAGPLTVHFGQTSLSFPPASFLQATEAGETALINFATATDKPKARILDLFCGLGGFGLSFENAGHVHFADLDGPAAGALERETRKNAKYQVSQRNLIGDAFTSGECNDYDLVVFDPPRGGAKAQATQLAKSTVPEIIAVSCDPVSFARDAKILIDGGYALEKVLPVDQFLWSPHMELAARFVK